MELFKKYINSLTKYNLYQRHRTELLTIYSRWFRLVYFRHLSSDDTFGS